jgi:predicted CxxxxCH...CXXCH cytochrome family protein
VGGATSTTDVGVGAHQAHLKSGPFSQAIACSECHVVPARVEDPGHMDGAHAIVTFGPLASTGSLKPSWDSGAASCSSVYCHGATLPGGSLPNHQPKWTQVDGTQAACGTCHGIPPPASSGHPAVSGGTTACAGCHPGTVKADGTIDLAAGKHVNGVVDLGGMACTTCHGDSTRAAAIAPAPPKDTKGNTATTAIGVGAHQSHLVDGPLRQAVACSDCHTVPSSIPHANGVVDITFSSLAKTGGLSPAFNPASATCASTYCHGATLPGGSNTAPVWTKVDGTQAACGSCHGIPPPASSGHPVVSGGTTACAACHPGTVKADGTIDVAGGKHINGVLDVSGGSCTSCHGDSTRAAAIAPAPPKDTKGNTATTALGVGAHQSHLNAGPLRGAIACSECHVVPSDTTHSTSTAPPPVIFGSLATSAGAAPTWNRTSATCASTYCHGGTLSGGSNTIPQWTRVDGTQAACGSCHGLPPSSGRHGEHSGRSCGDCHGGSYTRTVADPSLHVNGGNIDVGNQITSWNRSTGACVGCHGNDTWR